MSKLKWKILGLLMLPLACVTNKNLVNEPLSNPEDLGMSLFFDPILSLDQSISCASCHLPSHQFADTVALSAGVNGKKGTRNTPSVTNMADRNVFFWDGRANSLESQALFPISNPNEMNLGIDKAVDRLQKDKKYAAAFLKIFGNTVNPVDLGKALAAYETTLETTYTPFDKFMNGDESAISESAKRGQEVFNLKGKCFDCHFGPDFTADEFKNIGLFNGDNLNDSGRYLISRNTEDIGKFKVPGLRNIVLTAPYMHNGMFKTLQEVIDFYNNPNATVGIAVNRDTAIKALNLTVLEKADLLAFLKTLNNY